MTAALGRRLLAESVGTALLVTVVVGSGIAAQNLSPGDTGLQLLENSLTTAFGLAVLILLFGPVSGAHFNPVVSGVDWLLGRRTRSGLSGRDVAAYTAAQIVGAILGAVLANAMFDLAPLQISTKVRATAGLWLGEIVATAGLVALIFALARTGRAALSAAGGRRLHRRRLLVHLLDLVRQPRGHHRADVLRHLRRHRPGLGARLRHRPDRRGRTRRRAGAGPLPRRRPRRRGRGGPPRHQRFDPAPIMTQWGLSEMPGWVVGPRCTARSGTWRGGRSLTHSCRRRLALAAASRAGDGVEPARPPPARAGGVGGAAAGPVRRRSPTLVCDVGARRSTGSTPGAMLTTPRIVFVCTENAARPQLPAARHDRAQTRPRRRREHRGQPRPFPRQSSAPRS